MKRKRNYPAESPRWVWTLWRAATYRSGRYVYAERCHVGMRPVNHCLRLKLAYVRHGHLKANARGRAELQRRGFALPVEPLVIK